MKAPPRSSRPASTPPRWVRVSRGDVLRLLLAGVLAWVGATSLLHLGTLEQTVRDSGVVDRGVAGAVVLGWSLAVIVTAAVLTRRTTARAGAVAAALLASAVLAVAITAWVRNTPVACSCAAPTLQRGPRHHAEAVVGDLLLVGLAIATLTAHRGSRYASVPPRGAAPTGPRG